jgi:hypothetical protein
MTKVLPKCIRVDARTFTHYEYAALMLDELEQIAYEGDALDHFGLPAEAGIHLGWWASLTEGQRDGWRCWLARNIQADELRDVLRRRR